MSLVSVLPKVRGEYREDFNLAKSTWFKVGGNAEVLFKPFNTEDLLSFLAQKPQDMPITVLGACSNVIIRDGGISGVVIKLGKGFTDIEIISANKLRVGSAVLNSSLVQFCLMNSISGFEFMASIPGSVGGGIAMNAGAYGAEYKDIVDHIIAADYFGNIHKISNQDIGFKYRGNNLPRDLIFLEAVFNYKSSDKEIIKNHINYINDMRNKTQPIKEKTGGSTFANPKEYKAWKLIDEAGLRGYCIGNAKFSELHCNFMINLGNAKASELEALGELAIEKVWKNASVLLEWEIKRIGIKK